MPRQTHLTIDLLPLRFAFATILSLLALILTPGISQARGIPDLAAEVKSCVVNISTTQVVQAGPLMPFRGGERGSLEEFFEHFFGDIPQGQRETMALGSGFIISRDGLILTNNHVVAQARSIKVRLQDQKEYDAVKVGADPQTDLALIRVEIDGDFPSPARLGDSDRLRVGSTVMAIGNPFGLGHTVTAGIVSAKGRVIGAGPYDDFLQTDTAINPGNSGGPLFNMAGEVIGINTAIVARGQGIGFAIPVNLAVDLLPQLKSGKVVRGWMGVMIQDINQTLADAMDLDSTDGVLIADTVSEGPADKAGLERGDVILGVNDQPVDSAHTLSSRVAAIAPDTSVDVTIQRNGKKETVPVRLGTRPEEQAAGGEAQGQSDMQWGVAIQELTPALAERLGYDRALQAVVIARVEPGSPAAEAGLQPGDLIREVNRRPVATVEEFKSAMGTSGAQANLLLLVKRGQNTFFSVLEAG